MSISKCVNYVGYVIYTTVGIILVLQECCYSESCPKRGDVRLQGGRNKFEGQVEVCGYNGGELVWKTVCSVGWDEREALLVCRQMRFSGNLNATAETQGAFNSDISHRELILKRTFICEGNEVDLFTCAFNLNSLSYCKSNAARMKPAGVYCFGKHKVGGHCNNGEIRLIGTQLDNAASGRVEVCLDGLWGTVCDDGWDSNDANTVCRQLGYNNGKALHTKGAYFGEGNGPIHLSQANCTSNDTKLTDCNIDKTGINGCKHSQDAGVICTDYSNCKDFEVHLVGGECEREGRVEICYNGVWSTVCGNGWDQVDAGVVCRQLGFNYQRALPTNNSQFGAGGGPVLVENGTCSSNHSNISQCMDFRYTGTFYNCITTTAGVICADEDIMMSTSTEKFATTAFSSNTTVNTSHNSTSVSNCDDTLPTALVGSGSIILPIAYGITGALVATAVIAIVIIVVVMRKRRGHAQMQNSNFCPTKSAMDNPTYEENANITSNARKISTSDDDERVLQNPLYSDIGRGLSKTSDPHHPGKDFFAMDDLANASTYYEITHSPKPWLSNVELQSGKGVADDISDCCYSAIDHSTEYSTITPCIPKPYQEQLPSK